MGVRGLQSYTEKNGCTRKVDIVQAIKDWKKTNANCVIVIDMMGLCGKLCDDKLAVLCGHRYWLLAEPLAAFFRHLTDAGAALVFFNDGPPQSCKMDVWAARQMEDYAKTLAINDMHKAGMPLTAIAASSAARANRMLPELWLFKQLCAQFGPVHVSVERECDLELAKYATDNRALAIIAQDSDFLIFPGQWRYWSSVSLDLCSCQTVEFDRRALRDHFGFTSDRQLPAFAALLGNDILPFDMLQTLHKTFRTWDMKFRQLAEFVRAHFCDDTTEQNRGTDMANLAQKFGFDVKLFWQAYGSYDISYAAVAPHESRLSRNASGSIFALIILDGYVKSESFASFDLRNTRLHSIIVLLGPLYRRLAGIVWHNQPANGEVRRCMLRTRVSHESPFTVVELEPSYPGFATPPLKELLQKEAASSPHLTATRYRLLAWVVSGKEISDKDDPFVAKIRALPSGYVLIMLTLHYLIQMGQFTVSEADAVLAAEMDVFNGLVPRSFVYPSCISLANLLLVRVYTRFFTYMQWSMELCGIEPDVNEKLRFDSVYFHKCRTETHGDASSAALAKGRAGFSELRSFYA